MVPASRGGREIVAGLPSGSAPEALELALYPESGSPVVARRIRGSSGADAWSWPAPDQTQLCRIVLRPPDVLDSSAAIEVEQAVEDPLAEEHTVLVVEADAYHSRLFQYTTHGTSRGRELVSFDDGRARFSPSDPRDHLATRFLPLSGGIYELRIDWGAGQDPKKVLVRPQLLNFKWLETRSETERTGDALRIRSRFEVPRHAGPFRLHLIPSGEALLPNRIELVRLTGDKAVASVSLASTIVESGDVVEGEIRGLVTLGDASSVEKVLAAVASDVVTRAVGDDPWLLNYTKNLWEFVHGKSVLTTYPTDICIPIADICNARCTFCTSWFEGREILHVEQIDRFEEVLRFGRLIGLAGHGEPLSHPQITDILARLDAWLDPRARGYVITNGVYLPGLMEALAKSRVRRFAVSLNAATEDTHREVMGLPAGSFPRVLDAIRALVARRERDGFYVSISLVVTRQNVHEIAAFVELANRLGVDKIQLKTLAPAGGVVPGLNYHTLPAYEHPDYARHKTNAIAAIQVSEVEVQADIDSWDAPIFPPAFHALAGQPMTLVSRDDALRSRDLRAELRSQPKYNEKTRGRRLSEDVSDFDGVNPFQRSARFACRAPYRFLYINDFSYNVSPCCYLGQVPGHEPVIFDGSYSFMEAWNSEAMVSLRRRLSEGPLFNMCTKCPGTY